MTPDIQFFFTLPLLEWFDQHGRQDLPWANPRTPYRVYVSEIMLQQTQVVTVLPYFKKFMLRFPDIETLAKAPEDELLAYWSGLGYYSRARNLHQTAKQLVQYHAGCFPSDPHQLVKLPGIGPSTAAAIASLAYEKACPILDGNVKRILSRYFMVEGPLNQKKTEIILYEHAKQCMARTRCADYTQAIMDLGALCCKPKQPTCHVCPLQKSCKAYRASCVDAYPSPALKKKLPTKHWQFLLFYRPTTEAKPAIYLEKRPHKGIWGGLWCLPLHAEESLLEESSFFQHLPPFKHTFTHFHLMIHVAYTSFAQDCAIMPKEGCWFHEQDLEHLGLPRPIKTVLSTFWQTPSA